MTTKKTPAKANLVPEPLSPSAPAADAASHTPPATGPGTIDVSWVLNHVFHDISVAAKELQQGLPIDQNLTGVERQRLVGVKARNYGFITKSWEVVDARPEYRPPLFSMSDMSTLVNNLNRARDLSTLVEQVQRLIDDYLLTVGSLAYHDALRIYGQLKAMANGKVPGAAELFKQLQQYFRPRRRRPGETPPTEAEMERDFRRLLHGTADGEMVIKNESPHTSGGVHEVVDDVHKHGKHGVEIEVKE